MNDMTVPDIEHAITEGPRESLPRLIGELSRLQALALARLTASAVEAEPVPIDDRLLSAEQASAICGLTVRQLKTRKLPFRRKIGHRTIRFSERALRAWLRRTT